MSLKKNILSLASAQAFNYIFPLLQFPYLNRVLGTDLLGLVMFGLSIMTILQVLTDYGLEIYLTKKLTESKNTKELAEKYLYQTLIVKVFLMFISTLIFIAVYKHTILNDHLEFSIYLCISIIINAINPMWLFQGMEKLYIYARTIIFSKIALISLIFIYIKDSNDYITFGSITLTCTVIVNVTLYFYIFYILKLTPQKNSLCESIKLLKNSFEYFVSRAGASIYIVGCSVFLGIFSVADQVSIYGMAEKLYIAGCGVFSPLISSIIPYMNRNKDFKLFYKISFSVFSISLAGSFVGYIFGKYILFCVFGENSVAAKPVLDILLIALNFNVMGILFGYPALMPIGKVNHANLSVIYSGIIQVCLFSSLLLFNIPLTAINVSITFLVSTIFTFSYRLIVFIRYRN